MAAALIAAFLPVAALAQAPEPVSGPLPPPPAADASAQAQAVAALPGAPLATLLLRASRIPVPGPPRQGLPPAQPAPFGWPQAPDSTGSKKKELLIVGGIIGVTAAAAVALFLVGLAGRDDKEPPKTEEPPLLRVPLGVAVAR